MEKRFHAPDRARMFSPTLPMSRRETPAVTAAAVAPRAFLALAVGFLLLYAAVLVAARQQRGARAQLESVVPLPPRPDPPAPADAAPEPAPTPTEP